MRTAARLWVWGNMPPSLVEVPQHAQRTGAVDVQWRRRLSARGTSPNCETGSASSRLSDAQASRMLRSLRSMIYVLSFDLSQIGCASVSARTPFAERCSKRAARSPASRPTSYRRDRCRLSPRAQPTEMLRIFMLTSSRKSSIPFSPSLSFSNSMYPTLLKLDGNSIPFSLKTTILSP